LAPPAALGKARAINRASPITCGYRSPSNNYWQAHAALRMIGAGIFRPGKFLPASEAKVSVFDRGFTSGEGVYDVTRSFGHKLFKLQEHVDRLYRSLQYTHIPCKLSPEEMTRLSAECFERNR